jgi:hypothetical protein
MSRLLRAVLVNEEDHCQQENEQIASGHPEPYGKSDENSDRHREKELQQIHLYALLYSQPTG